MKEGQTTCIWLPSKVVKGLGGKAEYRQLCIVETKKRLKIYIDGELFSDTPAYFSGLFYNRYRGFNARRR